MGIGYTKACSIPQGDPWSMFALALAYKPWPEVVRQIPAQPPFWQVMLESLLKAMTTSTG